MLQSACIVTGAFGRLHAISTSLPLATHAHQEWNLIFHLHGPPASFWIEELPFPLHDSEVLVLPPWVPHSKSISETGPSFLISMHMSPTWIEAASAAHQVGIQLPGAPQHSRFSSGSRQLLEQICMQAIDIGRTDQTFERSLVLLLDSVAADAGLGTSRPSAVASRHPMDNRIRKALSIILESEGLGIDLDRVARQVGLSRAHFFKRFRECVGTSPHHAVDAARISWSVGMLAGTEKPILEIADALGFSTQGHFTRFFVKHLLVPPTWYREALRRSRPLAPS